MTRRMRPSSAIHTVRRMSKLFGDSIATVSSMGTSASVTAMWVPAAAAKSAPTPPVAMRITHI